MYTWSLDDLYKDFNEDFLEDLKTLDNTLDALSLAAANLNGKESLEEWLTLNQNLNVLIMNLSSFTVLRMNANTLDAEANRYYGQILNLFSKASRPNAIFTKWIASKKDDFPTWVNESALIKEHEFILQETIDLSKYALSEDVEEAISRMKINASSAWSQLQSHLTSVTTIEYEGKNHTLTSLRNLAYSNNKDVRKSAYEKELELYPSIEDSVAYSLNSIKGQVIQTNAMRGYNNALEETLIDSRLSSDTLDSLVKAIENALPELRRYLKHKAKLMGYTNGLPWYEMFAPVELSNPKEYTIDDSRNIIIESFGSFASDLQEMATQAYDDKWIDFLPREGKVGGAFCYNLPHIKQSRILSNFGGSISDIVTLAHELGHAYHGLMLEDNSILNTDYTMPVAETASTFCENIVFNASLETASDEEKIMLIENSLQDLVQITVDILSRYKFETEVFDKRSHDFLDATALKEIMTQAQEDTYGDGLDSSTYHPYMWIAKGHYYSAESNFYNFPYAFGGLFALGLYAQFEKEGKDFVPKYRNLLKATASASCEDVAKLANIDTTQVAFWESSLDQIVKRIDQYIELTSK